MTPVPSVPGRFSVPQTVRGRMHQVHELFGDQLRGVFPEMPIR